MSFASQKLFSIMISHVSILDLRAQAIGVLFRKFPPVPMTLSFFPTSSSMRFSVSGFMLRSLILGLQLCTRWQIWIYFNFSTYQLPVKPAPFIEDVFFLPLYFLASLSKIKCPYVCNFISESFNSIFLINLPVSVPIPCNFYHYFSVAHLEVRKGDYLRSSLIVFKIMIFFIFSIWNWELVFPCLWRVVLGFWWGLCRICRLLLVVSSFLLC